MLTSYNPPTPQPTGQDRSFPTFRRWVEGYFDSWFNYLVTWLSGANGLIAQFNSLATGFAANPLPAGTTISPTNAIQRVTSSDAISVIAPVAGLIGPLMLYSVNGFTVAAGGNITPAQAVPAGHGIIFFYEPVLDLWVGVTS